MDYTYLKTYKMQVKYVKMKYEMKIHEIDYQNKVNELRKINQSI